MMILMLLATVLGVTDACIATSDNNDVPKRYKCDEEWNLVGTSCYQILEMEEFDAAENKCVSAGGHLASIHSKEQNDALGAALGMNNAAGPLWIGLKNTGTAPDVEWTWTDGSDFDYKDSWAESPETPETKKCVAMSKTGYTWSTYACTEVLNYVCQYPADEVKDGDTCDKNWTYFSGSCYMGVDGTPATFKMADNTCKSLHTTDTTYLVSINTEEENKFLQGKYNYAFWLGLTRTLIDDDNWIWRDSTPWTKSNNLAVNGWAENQPTHQYTCAQMPTGDQKWIEADCEVDMAYVCEYKAPSS